MDAKTRILRDAARYLGIRGAPAGRALAVLEEAYPMAREAARPRSLIRRAPMRAREGVLIIGDALTIPSQDLCRLFAGALRDWRWRSPWARRWTRWCAA